jgi:sugar phosphate isomerase/epimerase
VLPDHVVPNVEWLAGKVDDVQLLLVEPEGDVPGPAQVERLCQLASLYGHSYTVHLPTILTADGFRQRNRMEAMVRLIRLALPVEPLGWVVHVAPAPPTDAPERKAWRQAATALVKELASTAEIPVHSVQVENQGEQDVLAHVELAQESGAAMCMDLGHILREKGDPLAHLEAHLPLVTHLHVHGVADRDHRSLVHYPALGALLDTLVRRTFTGVFTMEVFGVEPFESSLAAVLAAWARRPPPGSPA